MNRVAGPLRQLRTQGRSELYGLHKHENDFQGRNVRSSPAVRAAA